MNDLEHSDKSNERGKTTRILSLKDCDAMFFPMDGDNVLLNRQFVFGKEDRRRDHNLAVFTVSDYSREQNLYATLKLEKEGRDKQVRVVWLEPK